MAKRESPSASVSTFGILKRIYDVAASLPRFGYDFRPSEIPTSGIYLIFEAGEVLDTNPSVARIVRVGTHRADGRLPLRLRQHYGRVKSLRGDRNSSVFRKHLGAALMRLSGEDETRIQHWLVQNSPTYPEIEAAVSERMRSTMTFVAIPVPTAKDRLELEAGLIAALAQSRARPSEGWLGKWAVAPDIKATSLWNTQQVRGPAITTYLLDRLEELARR